MINRFIRNFLYGQQNICKVQQIQTVRVAFLHQCIKNECPTAVISCGTRMASSSSSKFEPAKHVVEFAQDARGSRFIEQKLGRANPTEKAHLMDALRGHVLTLAQQVYGCHVIKKALETIINEILAQVIPLSLHKYGSWVIRFVLEHCTHKRLVLEQLHANVPTLVTDKYGSYVIRHVIEHGLPKDRERIVRILQENVPTLVMDQYGSYVIEHVLEHGLPEDRERIVRSLQGDIIKYAQDKFGCLVIEKCLIGGTADQKKALIDNKFFECGADDQKAQLVVALRGHVLTLAQQMYGSHVIGAALKSVDKASQIEIINEILEQVIPLSLHKYGSWVIRFVLEHCTHKRLVLEQLHANVSTLVTDKYGSYVIRHVIEHGLPEDRARIVRSLHENITSLAIHECGYRVIQCLLEHCTEQQNRPVLEQLLGNVLSLVTDQYGSFVIESVLEHGRPEDRERIVRSLQGDILKHIHRKCICSIIQKCLIFGTEEQKNAVIDQVCADDGTGKPPLLQMMKKQFANDVVLKMVDGADSAHRDKMMFAIEEHIPALLKRQQSLKQKGGRRNR
ncbi:Pumilio 2 [Globodera pallida]|nr:Pumilio 2 [Globodera pallida]